MRRYSLPHVFALSFFSRDLYREVARVWTGAGLLLMLILSVISTLATVLTIQIGLGRFVDRKAASVIAQLPTITIANGVVSVDGPMPVSIRDPETGRVLAIIDTTGSTTSLEGTGASVLLTRDRLFYAKSRGETRVFDLSRVQRFHLDRARATRWARGFATYCGIALAPFILLGIYVARLAQQAAFAALGLVAGRAIKVVLGFTAAMRVTAAAFTPAILLESALGLAGVRPRFVGFLWLLVTAGYLVFALSSCREAPASEIAAAPAPPAS